MGRILLRACIGLAVGVGISYALTLFLPPFVCWLLAMFCVLMAYGSLMPPRTSHDPVQGTDIHREHRREYESNWGKRVQFGVLFLVAAFILFTGLTPGAN